MSLDSPAKIIPFTRFLECRERRIVAAKGRLVPASTDPGTQPEATGSANADHGEPPRCIADRLVDA
jgi:hypothetical protein